MVSWVPIILVISVVGTYSLRNNMFDVTTSLIFGGIGYLIEKVRMAHGTPDPLHYSGAPGRKVLVQS